MDSQQVRRNVNRFRFALFLLTCLTTNVVHAQTQNQFGHPNIFLGKAGAAGPASLDAISLNPALAGELEQSEAQVRWGMSQYDYSQRYPGFEAKTSKKSSPDPNFPIPSLAYKFNRRFGMSGLIIPFPVQQDIAMKDMAIVILDQQSSVDIEGQGALKALVDLNFGYEFHPMFSMGANLYYIAIEGKGDVVPTNGNGEPIASFEVASSTIATGLGIKLDLDQLAIGLSTRVFEQTSSRNNFETPIKFAKGNEEEGGEGEGASTSTTFLNPIRLGLAAKFRQTFQILFDVEYNRAREGQTRFSIVDFAEKDLDVYDTLSVYLGALYEPTSQTSYMFGYFNEPSSIGPGSQGKGGKAGFGFFDLALAMGEPPSLPIWGIGAGVKHQFDRISTAKKKSKDKEKEKVRPQYRMAVEGGLVYSESSIGIDADGEQPGAYLAKRYRIPLRFVYRF